MPDHGKLTPWRFIVFEGDARARAGEIIAQVFANSSAPAADIEIEKRRLMDAPLVIAVVKFTRPHPKVPAWEQELSAGASAMNIVTAASALGYGANWLTGWFAFDRDVLNGFGLKGIKSRRFHRYRHPSQAGRGSPAPGAVRYRDAVLDLGSSHQLFATLDSSLHRHSTTKPGTELSFCAGHGRVVTTSRPSRARSTPQVIVEKLVRHVAQFDELPAVQISARWGGCIAAVTLD